MHTPLESPRGRLLEQYVCVRIIRMNRIDIGLYDYDRHNALYYFVVNADETIYLRYGGRDAAEPDTYLDLDSLEIALRLGLEEHKRYGEGLIPKPARPEPSFPRDIPLLKREVIDVGRCVECHLIGDYTLQEKERNGTLDKLNDLFAYPDIKTIGIELDVPKGLVVGAVSGAVEAAGMRKGDLIQTLHGKRVLTFGDLQHAYNKVSRDAVEVTIDIERDGIHRTLIVELPREWWYTDLFHRMLTVDPQLYFAVRPLTAEEKADLDLDPTGFASEVIKTNPGAKTYALHQLLVGDIIYQIDGQQTDLLTQNVGIYIKLTKESAQEFDIKLLRDGEAMDMRIRTRRQNFRKPR